MSRSGAEAPSRRVLRCFGVEADAERLPGGQGTSWLAGGLVFKPAGDEADARWWAEALDSVVDEGCRVARPVPSTDGRWVVDGWGAARWLAGEPGPVGHWHDVLAASSAFHAAVRHLPRPPGLDRRTDWWALADRSTWEEAAPPDVAGLRTLRSRLERFTRPAAERPQLVHGDLSGNVLLHPRLPPAIIDVSPYWRPQVFADAVVIADGLLWWGEGGDLIAAGGRAGEPAWLARGLLFRLDTMGHQLAGTASRPTDDQLAPYAAAVDLMAAV